MGIVNRTLDASQQRRDIQLPMMADIGMSINITSTGSTGILWMVPYPCVIEAARACAFGLSAAPKIGLWKNTAATWNHTGISMLVSKAGVSGPLAAAGFTTGAGATLQQFNTGDLLCFDVGVANTAVQGGIVSITVRKLQDIVSHWGI